MKYNYILLVAILFAVACSQQKKSNSEKNEESSVTQDLPEGATSMFNGKNLDGWEITNFGTEGPIMVSDGKIVINMGDGCSGITWTKDFPKVNYEVNLEARKIEGQDFFCGLTFPVNEDYCSFIVGGWGGPVVGLSSIDGLDASDNETNTLKRFDKNTWYKIKLQVSDTKIIGWIDGEKLVDFTYTGRQLSIRPEVSLSTPFGICTWTTSGEYRNIWMKQLN